MKTIKTIAVISGTLTLIQLVPTILSGASLVRFWVDMKTASAIGIIGSADGPTSIVVAGYPPLPILLARIFFILCVIAFIGSTTLYLVKKNK